MRSQANGNDRTCVNAFLLLEEHGFDQVPTGNNCYGANENMIDMTKFCTKHVAPERLCGFMDARGVQFESRIAKSTSMPQISLQIR